VIRGVGVVEPQLSGDHVGGDITQPAIVGVGVGAKSGQGHRDGCAELNTDHSGRLVYLWVVWAGTYRYRGSRRRSIALPIQ